MGEQQDRLVFMAKLAGRQDRLVLFEQGHMVAAGNVPVIDDDVFRPVDRVVEMNPLDPPARRRRPDRRPEQDTLHSEVIHVLGGAAQLVEAVDPRAVCPDMHGEWLSRK